MILSPKVKKYILGSGLLAVVIVGSVLGKFWSDRYQDFVHRQQKQDYMQQLLDRGNAIFRVANSVLEKVNNSPYEICSTEDIIYQRKILFEAPYIKDIGRLKDEMLLCSTLLGPISSPHQRAKADVENDDGFFAYGFGELVTPDTKGVVVGKGAANLVLATASFDRFHTERYDFSVFLQSTDRSQHAALFEFIDNPVVWTARSGSTDAEPDQIRHRFSKCDSEFNICVSVNSKPDNTIWYSHPDTVLAVLVAILFSIILWLVFLVHNSRAETLLARLRKAIDAGDLKLVYQPIARLCDGKIVASEALLRWEITKGDFVPPDVFIAKAEEAGMIDQVTQYVIDLIIREMGEFLVNHRDYRININITAYDLCKDGFVTALGRKLSEANIEPKQVGIELTERTPIDPGRVGEALSALSRNGHSIYIDDFGTGYSSISYLSELKIDGIKIDKSFTRALCSGVDVPTVIPQIVSMAQEFGLLVVVEGIEQSEQEVYLRALDKSLHGQGWYYGKPRPANAVISEVGSAAVPN
ncbi:EAL domain-containing protein [Brucella pseudogrignonensis]|uniref:EAL domain-containing protein n=1 Tax=Brucella pseudogrignonensis TaxID=419475 RepID=UPI0038D00C04